MTENKLIFGEGNAKLDKDTLTFSLPAGFSCPGAYECLTKADPTTGVITDGVNQKYRCFAASAEAVFRNVREARWNNYTTLRGCGGKKEMGQLIVSQLRQNIKTHTTKVRVHVSGDFFSKDYFLAWMYAAEVYNHLTFYAYTKSIHILAKCQTDIPLNFKIVSSRGGKFDHVIDQLQWVSAKVVLHPEEAETLGLTIDHDDSLAVSAQEDFALLLHGTQPANSEASRALITMKKENIKYAYTAV
jgi:hypothetical protein